MEQIRNFLGKAVTERWLKAGYVDNDVFNRTEKGSGQGSVISPLLANIALHGMEEQLGIEYRTVIRRSGYQCVNNKSRYAMTRYADDCAPRRRRSVAKAAYNAVMLYRR